MGAAVLYFFWGPSLVLWTRFYCTVSIMEKEIVLVTKPDGGVRSPVMDDNYWFYLLNTLPVAATLKKLVLAVSQFLKAKH